MESLLLHPEVKNPYSPAATTVDGDVVIERECGVSYDEDIEKS
jgi:hypothetical protein